MANKKQAGTERPYTFSEFWHMIVKQAQEEHVPYLDQLDYLLADGNGRKVMKDPYAEILGRTHWGGSEGIYTGFYIINYEGEDIRIAVGKTLGEGDSDYIAMYTLAGHLCAMANRYIRKHYDEFNWTGFDVNYEDREGRHGGYCQCSWERAMEIVREKKRDGMRNITIRNNETRQIEFNWI